MRAAPTILAVTLVLSAASMAVHAHAEPTWTFTSSVIEGGQLDALRGPNDRVHVISSRYYQLDSAGTILVDEAQGDEQQSALDFPPALAVGSDGSAHIVTRHGGNWTNGHDIRYRRRNGQGNWDRDFVFGAAVKRNYVVSAAWADAQHVYLSYTQGGDNVWGDIHLWQVADNSANPVGDLSSMWRADADVRMRGRNGQVFLVSGVPDPNGKAIFSYGAASSGLSASLSANQQVHSGGSGRRGFTDLYVDAGGDVHLSYGALHTVYYNRYDSQGNKALAQDQLVFDGLGDWHMSAGLSAVAASDAGDVVVAVALRSDGSQSASKSDLMWSYSVDGGTSWSKPQDLGKKTDGGEGRRRPRLVAIGYKFLLLYKDNSASGISLATVAIAPDGDNDGYGADVDCDDTNPKVHPGAEELCNNIDDNCDKQIDEGCPEPPDAGMPPDDAGNVGGMGSSGGGSGGASSGTAPAGDNSGLTGSCNCRLSPRPDGPGELAAAVLMLALLQRRRRNSASSQRSSTKRPARL